MAKRKALTGSAVKGLKLMLGYNGEESVIMCNVYLCYTRRVETFIRPT